MRRGRTWVAGLTGAVAIFALALPCAAATSKPVKRSSKARVVEATPDGLRAAGLTPFSPPLIESGRFTFTAPGRGASTARLDSVERAFRFTPSGQSGRKSLSIGVTTNVVSAAPDRSRAPVETFAVAPTSVAVALGVGYRGFGVSGGYSRLDQPVTSFGPNRREAVDVALSYRGKNWKTALQVAAESGSPLLLSPLERRYSVDFGGAYTLAPRLQLSGGVRYQLAPVAPNLLEIDRPADGSVYLGTAFSF